jgi:ATP-binding cassette subfamily C protein
LSKAENGDGNLVRAALAACRRHFLYAGLFSGLINLLYLAPSIFMLQVYDRVVPSRGMATLFLLILVLAFALAISSIMDAARMRLLQRAGVRVERLAAGPLLMQILGADAVPPTERSQAIRDFDLLRATLTGPAIVALFDFPWAPIYILVSFLLHPWLGVLALVSAVMLAGFAWAGERANENALRVATARSTEIARMQDFSIQAADVARALGMRDAIVAGHLADRAAALTLQGDVALRSSTYLAAIKFLRSLLQSVALAVGAWLAIDQKISAGAIFAGALLVGRALQPIEQILAAMKNVLSARAAYRSLLMFCESAEFDLQRTTLPPPEGHITVERVSVTVPGGDRQILKDINFCARPGELIALLGASGAGKSTLLRVIAGALEPGAGEVRIDGARHGDWDSDKLGRHLGYLPQDPTLFPATIRGNISRLDSVVSPDRAEIDRQVIDAAMLAGAHDIVLRMPKAYETDLRSRDGGLSGGQRQVVALARALYGEPKMILLDEPTAHLDGDGEAKLMATFVDLKRRGATLIVSTHRTGILQVADKILLLRDGAVQSFGPRDQVLRSMGASPAAVPAPDSAAHNATPEAAAS